MADAKDEIRIVIGDDHPIFREGLRRVIERDPKMKIVGEAEDGQSALSLVKEHEPRIVILDIDMPGMDGLQTARAIKESRLAVEVIFLTMHNDEDLFEEAMDMGVKGYLLKDSASLEILSGIRAIAAGKSFISPALSDYLFNRASRAAQLIKRKPAIGDLTAAERKVLRLIARNKTSREIADQLFISPRTVDNHRAHISAKLGLRGAHALLKFALEHKSELSEIDQ